MRKKITQGDALVMAVFTFLFGFGIISVFVTDIGFRRVLYVISFMIAYIVYLYFEPDKKKKRSGA